MLINLSPKKNSIRSQDEFYEDICVSYLGKGGLRFWNNDVLKDMESVLKVIWGELNEKKKGYERFAMIR